MNPTVALDARLRSVIRDVPDFPRAGILFKDLTTLFGDADAYRLAMEGLAARFADCGAELVVGVESRGFVVGATVAYLLRAGFVPIRKAGRLPRPTLSRAYQLEYGESVLEIHRDAILPGQRVLVVDDLLATGGTANAAVALVEELGGIVVGLGFLLELEDLGGAAALGGRAHVALARA